MNNLGKLVVPNVFINVDIMIELPRNYETPTQTICDASGQPLLPITRDYASRIFDLYLTYDKLIDAVHLENEYSKLEVVYKRWRLPIHRPRKEDNLQIFEEDGKPPFSADQFEEYFKNTYYVICQVFGMEAKPFMDITPMVLVVDIQTLDARPFDYVSYIVDKIDHSLGAIKNKLNEVYFRHNSFLMHMFLHVGQIIGLWANDLRIQEYDRNGMRKPIQM